MFTTNEQEIINSAIQILESKAYTGPLLMDVDSSMKFFRFTIGAARVEHFNVAFLTSQHQLIQCDTLAKGTLDSAEITPREVAQRALELNAASCILAHNHPSGCCEPSQADKHITNAIKEGLELLNIKTLDHIIVSNSDAFSFARNGLL